VQVFSQTQTRLVISWDFGPKVSIDIEKGRRFQVGMLDKQPKIKIHKLVAQTKWHFETNWEQAEDGPKSKKIKAAADRAPLNFNLILARPCAKSPVKQSVEAEQIISRPPF